MRRNPKFPILLILVMLVLSGCAAGTAAPMPAPAAPPDPVDELPGVDVRIVVDKEYIASQLDAQIASAVTGLLPQGQSLNLLDPELNLIPDDGLSLTTTLQLQIFGINISLRPTLFLSLSVIDGDLLVEIESISLGQFALPVALVQPQIEMYQTMIQQQTEIVLKQIEASAGLRLKEIVVTESTLIVDLGE